MTMLKTYGWQSPEQLKFINENPQVLSLLYDLSILPEEISARVRGYVEDAVTEERNRCAEIAEKQARESDGLMLEDEAAAERIIARAIRGV